MLRESDRFYVSGTADRSCTGSPAHLPKFTDTWGFPVRISARIDKCFVFRFGNSALEVAAAPWAACAEVGVVEAAWAARSGDLSAPSGHKTIFAEFKLLDDSVVTHDERIPQYRNSFLTCNDRWHGYVLGSVNHRFPLLWHPNGGSKDGAFVRSVMGAHCNIDSPESPPCVFAAIKNFKYDFGPDFYLHNSIVSFGVRGVDLDLKGGVLKFGVQDWISGAFYTENAHPISVGNGVWTQYTLTIGSAGQHSWSRSFDPTGGTASPNPWTDHITGVQLKIVGMSAMPTGYLDIEDFNIVPS